MLVGFCYKLSAHKNEFGVIVDISQSRLRSLRVESLSASATVTFIGRISSTRKQASEKLIFT
jgi:hypothetical protein